MNDGPDGFERRKPDGLVGVTSLPAAQCDSPGWAYAATNATAHGKLVVRTINS